MVGWGHRVIFNEADNTAAQDSDLDLDEAERRMLKDSTFGEDRWALSLLLAKGLVSYRKRYILFGPRIVRPTGRGKKLQRLL